MAAYLKNYFNLEKSFVFYGSYHMNRCNQFIHVIFVPIIFTTSMSFIARIPITEKVNLSHVVSAFYALSFIVMEPVAGVLYAPVIGLMEYIGSTICVQNAPLSIAAHVIGWVAQIVAHKKAEGRQPAFTEDPLQAIHAAVFFVWLEVLFYFGYDRAKRQQLEELVGKRIADMKRREKSSEGQRKVTPQH